MSPGVTEEAGQTARSTIEALRQQPGLLFLTLVNIAFLVFVYFVGAMVKSSYDVQQAQINERYKIALNTVDRCIEAAFRPGSPALGLLPYKSDGSHEDRR